MAAVLTLVRQKKINTRKWNNTKNTVQTIQNTVNTSTHITKTTTHYKTHTLQNPHITKQVKTTTVQDTPKWNSHNINKYPHYKFTVMYMALLSPRTFYPQEYYYLYSKYDARRSINKIFYVPGCICMVNVRNYSKRESQSSRYVAHTTLPNKINGLLMTACWKWAINLQWRFTTL